MLPRPMPAGRFCRSTGSPSASRRKVTIGCSSSFTVTEAIWYSNCTKPSGCSGLLGVDDGLMWNWSTLTKPSGPWQSMHTSAGWPPKL